VQDGNRRNMKRMLQQRQRQQQDEWKIPEMLWDILLSKQPCKNSAEHRSRSRSENDGTADGADNAQ